MEENHRNDKNETIETCPSCLNLPKGEKVCKRKVISFWINLLKRIIAMSWKRF